MAALAGPVWAERPRARPERADPFAARIAAARLGGEVAYVVADAQSGAVLAARGGGMMMPPASVTKVVTTLFALDKLGARHRFETRVLGLGARRGAVWEGDIILAGGGDPTLDTDRLGDLVARLAATGLRKVTGRFFYHEGALPYHAQIAVGQPDHVGYNTAFSGLMLNFNRVNFVWAREAGGWRREMNAEGARFNPPVSGVDVVIAPREAPLFIYEGKAPIERWSVAEAALGKGGSRWLPLRRPAVYAAEVFATLCAAQGIVLPQAEALDVLPDGAALLGRDQSAPLDALLRDMLKYSTNITAETIGLAASGAGSQAASAQAMTDWARARYGIGAVFGDHSGLGPLTRCTAADMVKILARGGPLFALLREMGISEGREDKASALRVHAKSGTLNFVSALAGYTSGAGRPLIFAIFAADLARRDAIPLEARESPEGGAAWTKRARALQKALIWDFSRAFL